MSHFRSLMVYEEVLRGLQNRLVRSNYDFTSTLENGFAYLMTRLQMQSVSLFWWDETKSILRMEYSFRDGILMEGEEEINIKPGSTLTQLVKDKMPLVISERAPWVAFIPLKKKNIFIGAVRLERQHALPKGKILKTLSRFTPAGVGHAGQYPFLEDISDIFSLRFQDLNREGDHQKREQYLKAGSEVASAVVGTPRLREMLEAVSRSIVKNLGFDRIRFYLVDSTREELRGVLGLQIPDRLLSLEEEKYPMKAATNSLVDAVLDEKNMKKTISAGGKVVYVPLAVGGKVVGCMAVDNLLSQIAIDSEQISTLRSLAGQIGMAVLNARLFEDIEQQAITDGLTKLYVYRYFQARLKEEIDRADRYSYGVALVMIDVDNFKNFNDTYGHATGDRVLEFLAQAIRANIRRIDLAARYGGDEFILLLPEITEQEAWLMGSRLLNAIKNAKLTSSDGQKIEVRITLGVSMYPSDAKTGHDLMESADRALYWAKKHNRGDICFYKNIANDIEKTA